MADSPNNQVVIPDGYWIRGINSLLEPTLLKEGEFQFATNVDNSGGIIQTRNGFNFISTGTAWGAEPRGFTLFEDANDVLHMVIAIGTQLWYSVPPFSTFMYIGLAPGTTGKVYFQRVVRSAQSSLAGGAKTLLGEPIPYLIIQGSGARAKTWDGLTLSTSDPTNKGIPIGTWMQWTGGRLWVASGRALHASDLGDPLSFTEEQLLDGGNAIYMQDKITGLFQTPDLRSLLVGTDFNMSVIQSGVTDRTQWGDTPDFEKVILPGIGVTSGDSFCHQYGMTWWYSHGGLVRLDSALNTYRTSKVSFQDQLMMRDKANMSTNLSSIIIRPFGNYLLVAAPSGGKYNPHIWVLNQATLSTGETGDTTSWPSVWTGLNAVGMEMVVDRGEQRLLVLSRDVIPDTDGEIHPAIWEMFCGEREDISDIFSNRIPCTWESRFLGYSADFMKFNYAEIEIAEARGMIDLQAFVCSRRGGYHKILDTKIVATEGSANASITSTYTGTVASDVPFIGTVIEVDSTVGTLPAPSTIYINGDRIRYTAKDATHFTVNPDDIYREIPAGTQVTQQVFNWPENPTVVQSYLPQRRIIRTHGWNESDDDSCPVESKKSDILDRAFAILLKWTGKLAITSLRICATKRDDYTMGECKDEEIFARSLDANGVGTLSNSIVQTRTSRKTLPKNRYMRAITPKYSDDPYQARIFTIPLS